MSFSPVFTFFGYSLIGGLLFLTGARGGLFTGLYCYYMSVAELSYQFIEFEVISIFPGVVMIGLPLIDKLSVSIGVRLI